MATSSPAARAVLHPLDPLTAEEVRAAATILRRERGLRETARLISITLQEPDKQTAWGFRAGDPIERRALIVVRESRERTTYEAVVSLSAEQVVSWQAVPGAQPSVSFDEFLAAEQAIRSDPDWQAAMRRRGVSDFTLTMVDPWSAGYYSAEDDPSRRLIRALSWVRSDPSDNGYARPVENLLTLFDLDRMQVIRVDDYGAVPLPPRPGNYDPERIRNAENVPHFQGTRDGLRPVEISQPEGVSFSVQGHEVRWQKWRFRIGFSAREGLILHMLAYEDRGRLRPILHRASLAEMVVPYGDPSPTHARKNAFDEGEYGVGSFANALELGCDCLGEIRYFDAVLNDTRGEPLTLTNAICMHEEDFGILWKHTDLRTGAVEVRRSRRLVISSIATVGNYEYGFFWYLYQDGTIEYQIKLTGIMSTGAITPGEKPEFGVLVAPGLYGPNHQHFFNVRLDMMIDGVENSVVEVDSEALPAGPQNPYGNAWVARERLLARESEAQRLIDPFKARYWKVINRGSRNALGQPTAYRLAPGENVAAINQPEHCAVLKRAGFMARHLWVTRFAPTERFAAGDYPNQNPGGDGLPAYTAADRPLEDTDIVLWYTMGSHHIVRPEDWPVMPVSTIGFQLKPSGFFDGNPALDLPRPGHGHCHS